MDLGAIFGMERSSRLRCKSWRAYSFWHRDSFIIAHEFRKDKRWAHEDASEMMFDDMRQQYKDTLDISDDDAEYIKALIRGEPKRYKYVSALVHPVVDS